MILKLYQSSSDVGRVDFTVPTYTLVNKLIFHSKLKNRTKSRYFFFQIVKIKFLRTFSQFSEHHKVSRGGSLYISLSNGCRCM